MAESKWLAFEDFVWSPLGAGSAPVVLGEEFLSDFPVHPPGAAAGGFARPPEAVGLCFQILPGRWTSTLQSHEQVEVRVEV